MTRRKFGARIALLSVVTLLAAACGNGATDTPETTAAASPTTAADTPTTEPATPTTEGESPSTTGADAGGEGNYRIGYSNGGGVGNGFREEQVCTAQAEALASGQVSELTTIHRNTDAAGQLSDIRDLIAADVDAIVFNPNDPNISNGFASILILLSIITSILDMTSLITEETSVPAKIVHQISPFSFRGRA